MSLDPGEFKDFYSSRGGRLVRQLISTHIAELWPKPQGLRIMGHGYAMPYIESFMSDAERVFNVMPATLGVHRWPHKEKNLVCLADETALPIETESVDGVLMVHSLEHAETPDIALQEVWRVLKSNGRLLMIVPNRMGLWTRADWTPFGHGRPFSAHQISQLLQKNLFIREAAEKALFMPPFRSFMVMRTAYSIEMVGKHIFPGLAGLHVVEASKQIYSGLHAGERKRSSIKGRHMLIPDVVSRS